MKKLFLLFLLLLNSSCTSNSKLEATNLPKSKENKIIQSNEIKSERQTFIDNCLKEKFALRADICLSEFISYKVYDSIENIAICKAMHENGEYKGKCLWYFAMVYQDQKICDQIIYSEKFENKFLNTKDCKDEISYKNKDTYWVLKKGIPYLGEGILSYRGNAVVQGWVEYLPLYAEEPLVAQLHISNDSLESLPPSLRMRERNYFVLKIYSDDLESELISESIANELEKYNEQNPVTIRINALETYWEGSPAIGFVEIVN